MREQVADRILDAIMRGEEFVRRPERRSCVEADDLYVFWIIRGAIEGILSSRGLFPERGCVDLGDAPWAQSMSGEMLYDDDFWIYEDEPEGPHYLASGKVEVTGRIEPHDPVDLVCMEMIRVRLATLLYHPRGILKKRWFPE
jgi:hypothetical protein